MYFVYHISAMEELPEQIERIILAKLAPKDRDNMIRAFTHLQKAYEDLFVEAKVVDFEIMESKIIWNKILSVVWKLRNTIKHYYPPDLLISDELAGIACLESREFAYVLIEDPNDLKTWQPYFQICNIGQLDTSITKQYGPMIEIWYTVKHIMSEVFAYFLEMLNDICL